MESKKRDTNELICRTETDPQTFKTNHGYQPVGGRDGLRVGDLHVHTEVCGMTGQRGPAVEQGTLPSIL